MKNIFIVAVIFSIAVPPAFAQDPGTAGAFARMGFGARGMAMGNAMTAVTTGDLATYYNPAVSAFSEYRTAQATFSFLSFDRSLNFLSYTQSLKPTAGISIGLINAGVKNIDGRDVDGVHTDNYSTYEDQFFVSFSNRVDEHISIGASIKLYTSKLFDNIKTTTVGFDVGLCVIATKELSIGAVVQDINSKYKWNTTSIYGTNGIETDNNFPTLRRIGLAYTIPGFNGIITAEFENSSQNTNIVRFGTEYTFDEYFKIRGGVDRLDFSSNATGAKPSFGFTVKNSFNGWSPALNYAFVFESFAPQGMHIITLSATL